MGMAAEQSMAARESSPCYTHAPYFPLFLLIHQNQGVDFIRRKTKLALAESVAVALPRKATSCIFRLVEVHPAAAGQDEIACTLRARSPEGGGGLCEVNQQVKVHGLGAARRHVDAMWSSKNKRLDQGRGKQSLRLQ